MGLILNQPHIFLYICIEKMAVKCYNIMNYYRYKVGDKGGF